MAHSAVRLLPLRAPGLGLAPMAEPLALLLAPLLVCLVPAGLALALVMLLGLLSYAFCVYCYFSTPSVFLLGLFFVLTYPLVGTIQELTKFPFNLFTLMVEGWFPCCKMLRFRHLRCWHLHFVMTQDRKFRLF